MYGQNVENNTWPVVLNVLPACKLYFGVESSLLKQFRTWIPPLLPEELSSHRWPRRTKRRCRNKRERAQHATETTERKVEKTENQRSY